MTSWKHLETPFFVGYVTKHILSKFRAEDIFLKHLKKRGKKAIQELEVVRTNRISVGSGKGMWECYG